MNTNDDAADPLNSYRLVRKSEGSEMSYSMRVPINQRHPARERMHRLRRARERKGNVPKILGLIDSGVFYREFPADK
jgi:hypothetical protein